MLCFQIALEYISTLDADRDLLILRSHGLHLRKKCERVLRVCTMLLKKCAAKGLTPKEIAQVRSTLQVSGLYTVLECSFIFNTNFGNTAVSR